MMFADSIVLSSESQEQVEGSLEMQEVEMVEADKFKYLASTIESDRQRTREMKNRVQAEWCGWRRASG